MKRFAIIAAALATVAMLAAPAMAEFTPYASVRVHTDYVNLGDESDAVDDSDTDLNFSLASNSRFGGKFQTDDLGGQFEVGTGVNLRLLYGTYKMDAGTLLVGQTYTPYTNFSGQALNEDQGNIGYGNPYDGRQPQIKFSMPMGLSIAAIAPKKNGAVGAAGDIDALIPKLAVAYDGKFDPVSFGVAAAVNTISQEDGSFDETITSGLLQAKVAADAGPAQIKANVYFGQNVGNFGVITVDPYTGKAAGLPSASAVRDGNDLENTTTFGGWLQARFDAGMAKITAGVGYSTSDNDTYDDPDAQATYWINASVPIAKTFMVVPEFSYFDQMDDTSGDEESDVWRLGAKWQMNL